MRKIFSFILIIITFGALGVNAADKFVLVIDAGHGGHDPGARGKVSLEKNINLSVALAFGKYVERNCPDVKVIYTRKTDVFIELSERANIANRNKADLFISIHTNALDGGKISRGVETYTLGMYKASENLNVAKRENSVILIEKNYKQRYAGFDPNSSESYIMFELMQDKNMANSVEMAKAIQTEVCASSGRVNKGVHQAGFIVLKETSMPSCLLELGFITTSDEETYLNTTEGQDKMARGIYNAFVKYKKKHGKKLAQNDEEGQDYENPEYDMDMASNDMQSTVEELAGEEASESQQDDSDHQLSTNERRSAEGPSHIVTEDEDVVMAMTEFVQPREVRSLENFLAQTTTPPVDIQPDIPQEQNVQPPESPKPPKSSIDTTPEKENTPVSQPVSNTPSTHPKDLTVADDSHPDAPSTTSEETTPTTPEKEVPVSEPTSSQEKEVISPVPSTPAKEDISPEPTTPVKEEVSPAPITTPAKEEITPAPTTPEKEEISPVPTTPVAPAVSAKDTTSATTPAPPTAHVSPPATTVAPVNAALREVAAPPQGMALKGKPIFKVQIAASSEPRPVDSDFFKGVKDIDMYKENGMVKYAVGATENFAEVEKMRTSLLEQFPGAFIVAFRDGYKVSLQHALTEYRKQQKQQK